MSTLRYCGITVMFGIFLQTNKHQNLTRLDVVIAACHSHNRMEQCNRYRELWVKGNHEGEKEADNL